MCVYHGLFMIFELFEMMVLLSSVLVHVLLHFGVGVAQLLDKLPAVVLLVEVPDVLQD